MKPNNRLVDQHRGKPPPRPSTTVEPALGHILLRSLAIEKGQLIAGRYRLVESVGSGGMGVVWRAEDERLARTVAIKHLVVRTGLSDMQTEGARRRAMREARIAARLQHRNAISLFDVAEHDGEPCLVMEFLPSRSLSVVLADRGSLPAGEVADIGAQVAAALAAAHAAGIVHRDVKPGNILLAGEGTVKITDFGISRALDDTTVTQTGMLAGTPAYLAPEIARGQDPDRASDVFSLGATLYHAVEGAPPFGTNGNALALLHAVASGAVPPPHRAGSLTPVLMSLLCAEPEDRPTMAEAAEALSAPVTVPPPEQLTVPVRQPPPLVPATNLMPAPAPMPPAPARSRRTLLIVALIAVFAVAGIVTAMVINSAQGGGSSVAGGTPSSGPTTPTVRSTAPATAPPVQGPINWSQAGQLVIDYYNGMASPQAAWDMLSGNLRSAFGDMQAFQQYWSQYKQVSARNARGVTPNSDGSVNVPVDVTYTGTDGAARPEHKVLKVIIENGKLAIDSDGR
jgi:eukaryotic-like serine/threonine-protein kinase